MSPLGGGPQFRSCRRSLSEARCHPRFRWFRLIAWLSPAIILPELHAVIGALAALAAYAFAPGRLGSRDGTKLRIARSAVGGFGVIVLLKELLWDPVNESNQPFLWSGATDLGWYVVGISAMLALNWARFRQL